MNNLPSIHLFTPLDSGIAIMYVLNRANIFLDFQIIQVFCGEAKGRCAPVNYMRANLLPEAF